VRKGIKIMIRRHNKLVITVLTTQELRCAKSSRALKVLIKLLNLLFPISLNF
jgi:hypothetical protein